MHQHKNLVEAKIIEILKTASERIWLMSTKLLHMLTERHIDTDNKNCIKIIIKNQIFACKFPGNC